MLAEISYNETQQELIFFVGEADYQQELSDRGFETVLQERKFGISATMIRENPSKYWKYIAQPFRRQFTKKVLIMEVPAMGRPLWPRIWQDITMHQSVWNTHVSTRSKQCPRR